ncbi:MAG: hypothetical protein QXL96_10885 [Ignisphaera sp.]
MSSSTINIKYFVVGEVPKTFIDKVLNLIRNFIEIVNSIEYLEVYFYASAEDKILFLEEEAFDLGVAVLGDFIAMHEAWRGWSRIHIDFSRCTSINDKYLKAIVIHEVSHAILHGSPIHYYVHIAYSQLPWRNQEQVVELIYIATTAIKDIDVYDFLARLGIVDAIEDYVDFLANQYRDLGCSNVEDVLQLTKLLTPCLFLDKCRIREIMPKECTETSNKILELLNNFKTSRTGDLSRDTLQLLEKLYSTVNLFSG